MKDRVGTPKWFISLCI